VSSPQEITGLPYGRGVFVHHGGLTPPPQKVLDQKPVRRLGGELATKISNGGPPILTDCEESVRIHGSCNLRAVYEIAVLRARFACLGWGQQNNTLSKRVGTLDFYNWKLQFRERKPATASGLAYWLTTGVHAINSQSLR